VDGFYGERTQHKIALVAEAREIVSYTGRNQLLDQLLDFEAKPYYTADTICPPLDLPEMARVGLSSIDDH